MGLGLSLKMKICENTLRKVLGSNVEIWKSHLIITVTINKRIMFLIKPPNIIVNAYSLIFIPTKEGGEYKFDTFESLMQFIKTKLKDVLLINMM